MSYVAADHIRRSVKRWDPRDARDYYLGSAVYAWLFLVGEGKEPPPGPFDRRFREACDFYNYGLGLALTGRRSTNAAVHLEGGRRRLPIGEIDVQMATNEMTARPSLLSIGTLKSTRTSTRLPAVSISRSESLGMVKK